MRVIGGKAKGTKLAAVPGSGTRPILDRVKTALFDILRPELPGSSVLDLFSGTGGVGIEALSQGAEHCVFVERDSGASEIIRRNLAATHLEEAGRVLSMDVFRFLKESLERFDLIYVAPPQYRELWIRALEAIDARPELLAAGGRIVVQIDPREEKTCRLERLREERRRRYGNTLLIFYGQGGSEPDEAAKTP